MLNFEGRQAIERAATPGGGSSLFDGFILPVPPHQRNAESALHKFKAATTIAMNRLNSLILSSSGLKSTSV